MYRTIVFTTEAVLAAGVLSGALLAQPKPQELVGPSELALKVLSPGAALQVSSPAFAAGGAIPDVHSDYGERVSPPLKWSGVPPAAKTLVLLVEDPDAKEPRPFVHWVLYDVPATRQELPESVPGQPRLPDLGGALQGRSSRGSSGYTGPRPPKADPPHHYHFQLFALDGPLGLDPNAPRAQVLEAMKGRVLAGGELIGTFTAPPDAK